MQNNNLRTVFRVEYFDIKNGTPDFSTSYYDDQDYCSLDAALGTIRLDANENAHIWRVTIDEDDNEVFDYVMTITQEEDDDCDEEEDA